MSENQIIGTENNDFLTDTPENNDIQALGGDDLIEVSSGDDTVDGGEGNDELVLNYSELNEDLQIFINSYFDGYSNSGLADIYFPLAGNNNYINFNNIELLTVRGGSGNDSVDFGYDNYSNNQVDSGAGNDYIAVGLGNNTIDGGSGFDYLRLDFGMLAPEARVVSELTNSNSGQYQFGSNTIEFSNVEAVEVFGSENDDVLVALTSNINSNEPLPYAAESIIDGRGGKDKLVADYSDRSEDLMFGLFGYSNYNGYDYSSLNGSIDVSSYATNYNSRINFNNIESLVFNSGSGNDNIDLGFDNFSDDEVNAGAGDDYITAGLGNDTIDGGSGFDVLNLDFGMLTPELRVVSELVNSDLGEYEYQYGLNTIKFRNIEAINVIGSSYNDVLVAMTGNNNLPSMNPYPINQMIDGGDGKDKLVADYSDRSEDLRLQLNGSGYDYGYDNYSVNGSIDVHDYNYGSYNNQIDFNNIEGFSITTGSGNDEIELGYDNRTDDKVNTGAGDDFIRAGLGNDTIDGGSGFDVLELNYNNAYGVISSLNDDNSGQYSDGYNTVEFGNIEAINVIGSSYGDVLVALTGNNNLPSMNPYPMNQMIDGGDGKDKLVVDYGDRNEDLELMLNGSGYDEGYSYSMSGSINTYAYNYGNYSSNLDFNSIEGFTITSGRGNDRLELGYDNRTDDKVNAGAGDDYISAGMGNDTIDGGTGFDVLNLDYTSNFNGVTSFLTNSNSGQYSDGYDTVKFNNIEALNIFGSGYDDVLVAVNSNNNLPSTNPMPMNQMIDGGDGRDRLVVDYSNRHEDLELMLNGGGYYDGYNNYSISGSLDTYAYNYGNYSSNLNFNSIEGFTITSGSGNDRLELGYENFSDDRVNAGAGDDFIKAGLGNDTIDGGSGFDILQIEYFQSLDGISSFLTDGNSGQYSNGYDTVVFENIESLNVIGSNYNDVLVALTGNNHLPSMNPMPMNQMIDGSDGKDRLVVDYSDRSEDLELMLNSNGGYYDGYNNYSMSGTIDTYAYNSGNYTNQIDFNSIENFSITAGSGNDRLELGYENFSDDLVDAGAGDDFIKAGLGNDTIDGGSGFDVLELNYQNTLDGVTSFLTDSNSGEYSDGYSTTKFDNIESLNVIGSNYNDVLTALTNNNLPSMNPMPMNQTLDGGEGQDRLVADYGDLTEDLQINFYVYGNSGSVNVYAYQSGNYDSFFDFNNIESFELTSGKGNDIVDLGYDNFSHDLINAGEGDDIILASLGDDTIEGGKGNDRFIYELGHGTDVISDLSGNDTIAFGTGINLDNISLDFEDNDLVISVNDSPGDRLIVKDYAITGNSIENIDLDGQIFSLEEMLAIDSEPELEIGTIGQFGKINDLDHNSQTIQLEHNFENPVVFALPLSRNGGDPSIVRITDIQSDSFTAYLQEAEYRDGLHPQESFSYMVLEAGTWELENGALLEVGTVDTNKTTQQGWEQIDFTADFAQLPVILSQVQTEQDDEFVRTRQRQASVDGFRLSMEEEEALRHSGHGQETVGWLAMDAGLGDFGDLQYQAGHTGRRVRHHSATINFSQEFASEPSLFASIASFYGADASGLRYQSLDMTQATIMLEEDRSRDSETGHTKEKVDFLAIAGTGDLNAIAFEPDFG